MKPTWYYKDHDNIGNLWLIDFEGYHYDEIENKMQLSVNFKKQYHMSVFF